MAHELLWERNGTYWRYYGDVSGEEIIKSSTSIYGDSRFMDIQYKLVDFRDTENISITPEQVKQVAYQHKAAELSNPDVKNAIVLKAVNNQMAAMFAEFLKTTSWDVRIFDDIDDANLWLARNT